MELATVPHVLMPPALSVLSSQDIRSRVSNKLRWPSKPLLILLRTFPSHCVFLDSSSLLGGGSWICIPHYYQHRLTPWPLIVPIPAELFERNGISNSAPRPNAPALSVLSLQDIRSCVSNKLRWGPSKPPTHLIKYFSIALCILQVSSSLRGR
ncbi:hypothetical protein CEXT_19971 [Caerostris extrusa]|uniref:Uncharacterized protein n=1 Tax=Caerostris extrusa TaxID=172846 RepID=A0AAV4VKN2_CAEEX|nr:hypothetical protein CEXT_19971 [Caerostris extrusa]